MEDNSLDSFVNKSLENTSQESGDNLSLTNARPKLRKIKRPKQRTTPDIPPSIAKIMPEEISNAGLDDENLNKSDFEGTSKITDAPSTETSLITTKDANEISSSLQDSPYIIESLPPDLDYIDDEYENEYKNLGYVKKSIVFISSVLCLTVGLFIGKTFFSSTTIEKRGLEGVVINEDVPAGRPRCGLTDKNQACVFYLMNWYKQELNGRDFYKLAAQLTGREEYLIESDNLRYATVKIKPGHFAQLNIPALK